jgi:hypothetical protein
MVAGIPSFDVRYRRNRRHRTRDGLSRRKVLRGDGLWRVLEHGVQVRIVTWGRLHMRRRGIRGTTWARIIGRHRGVARGDHVWSWRNIRIALGGRAATWRGEKVRPSNMGAKEEKNGL